MSRCHVCGNEGTAAFCTFCGTPLGEPAPWTSQDPADAPTQFAPPRAADPYGGHYRPVAPPTPAYQAGPPGPPYSPTPQPYPPTAPGAYQPYAGQPPTPPPYQEAPPARPGGLPLLPVIAGVLALAVIVVGALAVPRLLGSETPSIATVTTTTTRVQTAAPASTSTSTRTTSTIPPATVPTDAGAEAAALAALQTTASGHQGQLNAAVAAHVWVAQLSSKYVGISDPLQTTASGSHTFNAVDILAEYRQLSGRAADATVILGDSRTFGKMASFNGQPYWRMMALSPAFTSSDSVAAWCARTFPELTGAALTNQCLPMQF